MFAFLSMCKLTAKQRLNEYQLQLYKITEQKSQLNKISTALADGKIEGNEIADVLANGGDIGLLMNFQKSAKRWQKANNAGLLARAKQLALAYNQPGQRKMSPAEYEQKVRLIYRKLVEAHRKKMVEEYKQQLAQIESQLDMTKERIEIALAEEKAKKQAYDQAVQQEAQEQAPKFA